MGSDSFDFDRFRKFVEPFEDRKDRVYVSRGTKCIGVGFNLERKDARAKIESLGLNYVKCFLGRRRSKMIKLTDYSKMIRGAPIIVHVEL